MMRIKSSAAFKYAPRMLSASDISGIPGSLRSCCGSILRCLQSLLLHLR